MAACSQSPAAAKGTQLRRLVCPAGHPFRLRLRKEINNVAWAASQSMTVQDDAPRRACQRMEQWMPHGARLLYSQPAPGRWLRRRLPNSRWVRARIQAQSAAPIKFSTRRLKASVVRNVSRLSGVTRKYLQKPSPRWLLAGHHQIAVSDVHLVSLRT